MADFLKIGDFIHKLPIKPLESLDLESVPDYDAYWELQYDKLYLTDIKSPDKSFSLESLFGSSNIDIEADWFYGTIEFDSIITNPFFYTVLSISFSSGDIKSHKFIFKPIIEHQIIKHGRYSGYRLSEIIKPKVDSFELSIINYISSLVAFLLSPSYHGQIVIPYYEFTRADKELLKLLRKSEPYYFINDRYISIYFNTFYSLDFDPRKRDFAWLLSGILSSDFTKTRLLKRNDLDSSVNKESPTVFLNPDHKFGKKYTDFLLKQRDSLSNWEMEYDILQSYLVSPDTLPTSPYKFVRRFQPTIRVDSIIEYTPLIEEINSSFNQDYVDLHRKHFEEFYDIKFDDEIKGYIFKSTLLRSQFIYNINDIYSEIKETDFILQEDSKSNHSTFDLDKFENDYYISSAYDKYNGAYGYDDDTIDNAFEGDPENAWNID